MRLCVLILFLLTFAVTCAAQSDCVLPPKNALSLHGLRLEMSPVEARNVLGIKVKVKKTGERTFFQNFIKNQPPPTLSGVRAVYLRFFNNRLYQIEIFYENRSDWPTLDAFTNYLSATWNLQSAAWLNEKGRSEIKCPQFSLVADNVLNPRVEITDENARAQIEELRKKK